MKRKPTSTKRIVNRRATFDYQIGDEFVVGLALSGPEVKALRMGHGHLRGAYVTVKDNELWLINATITGTLSAPLDEHEKTRTRKLLARRREIDTLIAAKQQGQTIVPLELLTGARYIKLKLAIGLGKKLYDKRATLKKRDQERDIARSTR